jgi:hypothetical protein
VRNFVDKIKLLNRDRVDLIENINTRYVDSITFNHINQVVHCRVALEINVAVIDTVLVQNGTDSFLGHLGQFKIVSFGYGDTSFVLSLQCDSWWLFV